tara:strand:+ start:165631 stop:166092 length:462 start_codon:yes stop_codon:yes gene_type:complete
MKEKTITKFVNYTNDRIINRDLNELDRIEKMLKPYPDKIDYNNINLAHVMLKEEQKRLQERTAGFKDRQKPLKEKPKLDTQLAEEKQHKGEKTLLNSLYSNGIDNGMINNIVQSNKPPTILNKADQTVQRPIPFASKANPATSVSLNDNVKAS